MTGPACRAGPSHRTAQRSWAPERGGEQQPRRPPCGRRGCTSPVLISIVVFLELTAIPVGPCRGLYVVAPSGKDPWRHRHRRLPLKAQRRRGRPRQRPVQAPPPPQPTDPFAQAMEAGEVEDEEDWEDSEDETENVAPPSTSLSVTAARVLIKERRLLNLIEREEGRAVTYLAAGGYRRFMYNPSRQFAPMSGPVKPTYICSGLHAGAGRQSHGWSRQQYTDLTLIFNSPDPADRQCPSLILFHNHHGAFFHYRGHQRGCPKANSANDNNDDDTFVQERLDAEKDYFRAELARRWSCVRPDRVQFAYTWTTTCDLFHGKLVPSTRADNHYLTPSELAGYSDVETCLQNELSHDQLWLPSKATHLTHRSIVEGIRDGSLTGFVTLKGGIETAQDSHPLSNKATSSFGFCVQNYAPQPCEVSTFTKQQIARYYGWKKSPPTDADNGWDVGRVDRWLSDQPARTLNSGTFHSEETISTTYLQWLMTTRGFVDFKITHLALYEFRDWSSDFLSPILQTRHDCKKRGDVVAAECLKLIGNGSFGYNGMEASNYSTVRVMTDESLRRRRRRAPMNIFNLKHVNLIGLVKVREKKPKPPLGRRRRRQRRSEKPALRSFADDEAAVANDDSDTDDDESSAEEHDRPDNKDDEVVQQKEMEKVLSLELTTATTGTDAPLLEKDETYHWQYRFLYTVSMSGDRRAIFNNAAKAVAILSNSKVLFFSHVHLMLSCLDPRRAELCYVDTDSCLWSQTFECLEDCLLPEKVQQWRRADILADESGARSCHGKMKLEGTFRAGQFKTMKIYRLYNTHVDNERPSFYTRCKGIQKAIGERLPASSFDPFADDHRTVHRTVLRPTKCGEIIMGHETRSLAIPFNLKRFVTDDGLHSFPLSWVRDQQQRQQPP